MTFKLTQKNLTLKAVVFEHFHVSVCYNEEVKTKTEQHVSHNDRDGVS